MADTCVARVPVFAGLSADEQARVATAARPTRLDPGQSAYPVGDDQPRLLVVHTGRLRISRVLADGAEQTVRVLGPGEFTGEAAVFTRRRPDHLVTALEASELCVFRHDDLEALLARHPGIGLRMLATVTERLSDTENRLSAVTSRGVDARLAEYLLDLPSRWHDGTATVTLPLAKKHVASLIDTSPESLSRALASLAAQGLVAVGTGRTVAILAPDRLQQLVDGA